MRPQRHQDCDPAMPERHSIGGAPWFESGKQRGADRYRKSALLLAGRSLERTRRPTLRSPRQPRTSQPRRPHGQICMNDHGLSFSSTVGTREGPFNFDGATLSVAVPIFVLGFSDRCVPYAPDTGSFDRPFKHRISESSSSPLGVVFAHREHC